MRILIIGNSKSAEILTDFFCQNPEHLVFTTKEWACGNYTGINSKDEQFLRNMDLSLKRANAVTEYMFKTHYNPKEV